MNPVFFDTPGELDVQAVTTFGLSVKEVDNPIGYFGTGFKYAIAILMRHHANLTIDINGHLHHFDTVTKGFRDVEYEAITMNGAPMPFTTQLGKNWKMWMAFRELYCNTLDEGGSLHSDASLPLAQGWTRISVLNSEFYDVYVDRDKYFITPEKKPDHSLEGVDIFKGINHALFYKNIRVCELRMPSFMTYNLTRSEDLTEDRTLSNEYGVERHITAAIAKCDTRHLIEAFVTAAAGSYEAQSIFSEHLIPSEAFMDVMKPLMHDHSGRINETAKDLYKRNTKKKEGHEIIQLNAVQQKVFDKAKVVCRDVGHDTDCNIKCVKSLGKHVLGLWDNKTKTVYLAQEVFEQGTKMVAGTLMEELIHKETDHYDCTRGMQNFLINRIMTMYEESKGEPL